MEQIAINDTIGAVSTPAGKGGIAVIRISGHEAISIVNDAWKGADLISVKSHTAHFGKYVSKEGRVIDEALATVFVGPKSFTGEDIVEISVHGSLWIQKEILLDLIKRGIRIANPGEFTQRAFLNGKIDLAQAEGIADLISSSSKAAHDIALSQIDGKFSKEFNLLREKLIEFASLMELELDFSEEDVEFADRSQLIKLCEEILKKISGLLGSYSRGAVLKDGVPVVIAGIPNAGKSSLLNLLLENEKAIVTDIPGTTRDVIEDSREIDGILYRFLDTAGMRDTDDIVEKIGVDKALETLEKAFIVIWVIDLTSPLQSQISRLQELKLQHPEKHFIILLNKADINRSEREIENSIEFSTFTRQGLDSLISKLGEISKADSNPETDIILTNARHYEALTKAKEALTRAEESLKMGLSGDFVAQDIREAGSYLSEITGTITTDTLLHSIFSRFCIGK